MRPTFQGDTYLGILVTLERNNGPWNLDELQNIHMMIRANHPQGPQLYYACIGEGIEIVDAPEGQFSIEPFVCDYPRGTHHYDVKIHDKDNRWITILVGTLKIYYARTFGVSESSAA